MTVGHLNERLDRISMSGSKKDSLPGLVSRLHEKELPVVLYVLLQNDKGQDIRCSLRAWLRHLHPDAPAVHEACAPHFVLFGAGSAPCSARELCTLEQGSQAE